MAKIDLLTIAEGAASWAEMETRIAGLPSEQDRGEAFEEFCKPFFILDPVFQFKEVYRHNEIPPSLRQQLGYPGNQDIGIDGLCVTSDDKLFAYQAKFRSDRNNIPTLRELSTFFTVSDRADWRITITNANNLPTAINDRTKQSRILSDKLDQLEPEFFDRLRVNLKEHCIKPLEIKTPNPTQKTAIYAALSYFKDNTRGQLILPCGTGKTLTAMWIAEQLGGTRILVMVPSLSLMSQTLREWAANISFRPFRYLCLCSDTSVDLGNDAPIEHLYDMDVPVTTEAESVTRFLNQNQKVPSILFSTYQSSKVLVEAVKKAGSSFDTAIFDEAHRTTGSDVGVWNMALDDKKVSINKRIFMTATPRIYAPHISKKAKENDILLYSMDDHEAYGKPFYEMTFGQAIEKNLITDYKVVIICVTDREVREIIQQGGRVVSDDNHEWDAKAFAKQVALVKAIEAYKLKKIFTFHSRVPSAKTFTQTDSAYSIKEVIKMLKSPHPAPLPQGARESSFVAPPLRGGDEGAGDKIDLFHVNGTMSTGFRNSIMREFKESEIGIMSNARCLIEGVDVPAVDTVAFIDPKKSIIDIVQATGRALRKAEWKEKGYIFIPVVVDEDAAPEDLIKSSDFDTVWEVLQAMMDQDQRLESIVSQLRTMQGEGKEDSQEWNNAMQEYSEKIEFFNLTKKIEHKRFVEKLYTKTIEMTARSWDFWYGLTVRYKEQLGDANVPFRYKTEEGFKLGKWQAQQKSLYKTEKLHKSRVKKLEEIGFDFSRKVFEESFEEFLKGVRESVRFAREHDTPNVFFGYKTINGFPLWEWQHKQRIIYKLGKLNPSSVDMLNAIGFSWEKSHEQEAKEAILTGIKETYRYNKRFGTNMATASYITPDGFPLGKWQAIINNLHKQVKLPKDILEQVEIIDFEWRKALSANESFEIGLGETLKYKDTFGNPNAPSNYVTPVGYKLGSWPNKQKGDFKRGELSDYRIMKLEAIGFIWKMGKSRKSEEAKDLIKKLVSEENPSKPLSDKRIVELLNNYEVAIQRRTVAKYREELEILSQNHRKKETIDGLPIRKRIDNIVVEARAEDCLPNASNHDLPDSKDNNSNPNLLKNMDELKLTIRSLHCLQNANIKTIADLVQKTELEMLKMRNFGRKSLNEIKEIITKMGLHFGMNTDTENLRENQVQIGSIERDES